MELLKKYKIFWSPKFLLEFQNLIYCTNSKVTKYSVCSYIQNDLINLISSLKLFPERYPQITNFKYKDRNIRKIVYTNYIIIYEVCIDIRQSLYSTYFPF